MAEKIFNGKRYIEAEIESQLALDAVGIHTFRYFPQDKCVMLSNLIVNKFGGESFIQNISDNCYIKKVAEKDIDKVVDLFNQIDNGEQKVSLKVSASEADRALEITISTLEWDDNGRPLTAIGIVENLDEDLRKQEIIRALSNNFNSIYYVDIDKDKVITYRVNSAVRKMFGKMLDEEPSYEKMMEAYIKRAVIKEDQETMLYETSLENLEKQFKRKDTYQHDYRAYRDYKVMFYRAKFVNVSQDGGFHRMVVGFSDVSSEKERELERMAYVDSVTGGDNYTRFRKLLRDREANGFLISMDIHSFKIINSICGVSKGDGTLKGIWKVIEKSLEINDIAAHINADRFVIFSDGPDERKVRRKINTIREMLNVLSEEMNIPKLNPYFGITTWNPFKKVEEAYNEANFAKNKVKDRKDIDNQFYCESDTLQILKDKEMEDSFMYDLSSGRFNVWYQPKYDPNTNEIVGAEGLVRWCKRDGSVISPGVFIPLFERDGLIKILDEYVFRTVCEQQVMWKKEGKKIVPISINLSRASLYFESVVNQYNSIAREIGVSTKYVPIEITESAAIDNENIKTLTDEFHNNGFPLLVDDFGAGYSSLATLNMNCFDDLKIDKSLIDYIGDFSGEKLLEHTISLAKELGLRVTAEGVETEKQVDFLKKLSCDSIQGFFYSRPLPKEDFEVLL